MAGPSQVVKAVAEAQSAFENDNMTPNDRAHALFRAADILEGSKKMQSKPLSPSPDLLRPIRKENILVLFSTIIASAEEANRLMGEMIPIGGAPGQQNRLGFTLQVPLGVRLRDYLLQLTARHGCS